MPYTYYIVNPMEMLRGKTNFFRFSSPPNFLRTRLTNRGL
ncbi:hypothetical protein HMPREF1985_01778 [Mitsuokella sp. oral taxon 131 str. W9106]|nr:hypothetical protein HMPREF1985_01778 [Mitsuokella sp. oral taxon 131 str. W9106]